MSLGRFGISAAALTALLALGSQAAAQDASTLKKDMIGQWELATTERSKTCVVTLKADTTPQGLKLELEPGCVRRCRLRRKSRPGISRGWISCGCRMRPASR
jgi:hypothetical protein